MGPVSNQKDDPRPFSSQPSERPLEIPKSFGDHEPDPNSIEPLKKILEGHLYCASECLLILPASDLLRSSYGKGSRMFAP
jgi:hypothetical protein